MAKTTRAALLMGLGAMGIVGLASLSYGQQGDGAVRKSSGTTPPAEKTAAAKTVFPIATIDLEAVIRGYEKAKFQEEQLKAESLAKQGQLKGIAAEAQQIAKEMESLQPGSKDFKDRTAKLTELKAKFQAGKETLEGEFKMKMIENLASAYKEAQEMTTRYAQNKGIVCVIKTSNEPINSNDPESVMGAISRPVMYSDPAIDITRSVLWNLNKIYTEAGGPIVKVAAAGTATTDEATAPASATQPQPKAAPARPAAGKVQK